jgi:hypothetical protein
MNLNTEGGDVLLLELSSQMTLDERGLSSLLVSEQDPICAADME